MGYFVFMFISQKCNTVETICWKRLWEHFTFAIIEINEKDYFLKIKNMSGMQ